MNVLPGLKFMKQPMMRKVVYSLIPIQAAAIYFFGWRSLLLTLICIGAGVFAEWIFKSRQNKPVTEAVYVSAILYAMTLPPSTPFWIAAVGIIFGIIFGKEVFGGFGKNVFNPALVGRAFVYVCFPIPLATVWNHNLAGQNGGLGGLVAYLSPVVDTVSTATPMLLYRTDQDYTQLLSLFLGNTSGSMGETSALLILAAGAYLIYTKTAAWENIVSTLVGFLAANTAFYLLGIPSVPHPLYGLLSGGILFGAVFMVTDPISSPKTKEAKWIYGILIGVSTVVIRGFALFAGGMMFAILIGNTFAPLLDEIVKGLKNGAKARKTGSSSGGGKDV